MFKFPQMSQAELISWTLDNLPLKNPPGEHYAYSNFGYCVLGRVIEKVTQVPYADYIQHEILERCGINQMRISGNTLEERAPNEVTYSGQNGEDPYGMNVRRMDSHGGWLAGASDLVKFAVNIGGINSEPGLLRPESITTMVTPSAASPPANEVRYAHGWNVRNNGHGNWWHSGSLPGTTTVLVRTPTGFCWSALANTRTEGIDLALDQMVWDMAREVKGWKP
jgi:CubicO group peptidase (beta-lactamase class C family)